MKYIEIIKLIFGSILLMNATIISSVFLLESFGILNEIFMDGNILSSIFWPDYHILIFLGFSVVAGAYLLKNVNFK